MANRLSESFVGAGRELEKPVSIMNANGGFPSGLFHEGPPSRPTNNVLRGSTKAMSKEIATVALMGVTTTAIAPSTRFDREVGSGWVGEGGGGTDGGRYPWYD